MANFSDEDLKNKTLKWQEILGLRDWDISCVWADPTEVMENCSADVEYFMTYKLAQIQILEPRFKKEPLLKDINSIEHSIIHELLHLHIDEFSHPDRDSMELILQERAINVIASALLKLGGEGSGEADP